MFLRPLIPDSREQPINIPRIIWMFVLVLLLIYGLQNRYGGDNGTFIILDFGFIPARFVLWLFPEQGHGWIEQNIEKMVVLNPQEALFHSRLLMWLVEMKSAHIYSWISYALLHGSWAHVMMNGFWIIAFGTPVARRLKASACLILFGATAIAGALAHFIANPLGLLPMIGASAIASGLMGAATRFMFDGDPDIIRPLKDIIHQRQVIMFVGIWVVTNLIFGVLARPLGFVETDVAWDAHIGGFLAGFLLMGWLDTGKKTVTR